MSKNVFLLVYFFLYSTNHKNVNILFRKVLNVKIEIWTEIYKTKLQVSLERFRKVIRKLKFIELLVNI